METGDLVERSEDAYRPSASALVRRDAQRNSCAARDGTPTAEETLLVGAGAKVPGIGRSENAVGLVVGAR